MTYIFLILGFVLLIKGADFFVDGSSSIARLLRIPSVIIGLTIVAFGTSLPEASVSVTAALNGANELSLSNVVGSNIFNLLVVVGVCAAIAPMPIAASVLRKEYPFSILVTIVLLILALDAPGKGLLSRIDGAILLLLFVLFLFSTVRDALKHRRSSSEIEEGNIYSPLTSVLFIAGGLTGIVIGGNLVVDSASAIAASFGLSQTFIGLTIVALGTSLPELVTSIVASRKGENDIALGNVVGSNIFNILLILGASSALTPIAVIDDSLFDMFFLLLVSALVFFFAFRKKQLGRWHGAVMLLGYAGFFFYIMLR